MTGHGPSDMRMRAFVRKHTCRKRAMVADVPSARGVSGLPAAMARTQSGAPHPYDGSSGSFLRLQSSTHVRDAAERMPTMRRCESSYPGTRGEGARGRGCSRNAS